MMVYKALKLSSGWQLHSTPLRGEEYGGRTPNPISEPELRAAMPLRNATGVHANPSQSLRSGVRGISHFLTPILYSDFCLFVGRFSISLGHQLNSTFF